MQFAVFEASWRERDLICKSLRQAGVSGIRDQKHSKLNKGNGSQEHVFTVWARVTRLAIATRLFLWTSGRRSSAKKSSALTALVLNIGLQSVVVGQDACTVRRHQTSICDRGITEQMLVATGDSAVTYPVVVVNVKGIKCRALLDTGAGSSYASAALLDRLRKRPIRKELRRIEMMVQSANQIIELHKLKISSLDESFHLETEVTKVNRSRFLSLGNPKYEEKIARFSHLRQGTKLRLIQSPMRLKLSCWRPRFKS